MIVGLMICHAYKGQDNNNGGISERAAEYNIVYPLNIHLLLCSVFWKSYEGKLKIWIPPKQNRDKAMLILGLLSPPII